MSDLAGTHQKVIARYICRGREETFLEAVANGHGFLFGGACLAEEFQRGDGTWFRFLGREGVLLWECNPEYARANFDLIPLETSDESDDDDKPCPSL